MHLFPKWMWSGCLITLFAGFVLGWQGDQGGDLPLSLSEAQEMTSEVRRVGGNPELRFPAVAALLRNGQRFCTGTLVTPTALVTASQCFRDWSDEDDLSVFFGPDVSNPANGSFRAITSVHRHPQYRGDVQGVSDIAVVVLDHEAPVTPIPLFVDEVDDTWVGESVVVVGYGVTCGNSDGFGTKRSVMVRIEGIQVQETGFSYSSPDKNTCFGDSGGPILVNLDEYYGLIGVTPYGDGNTAAYGVNSRVGSYINFIEEVVGGVVPSLSFDWGATRGAAIDVCEIEGWYGDGICDVGCAKPDPDCGR